MIKNFSEDVIQQIKYYVYRLIDPRNGQTFYVGRGCGNRVFDHAKYAKSDEGETIRSKNQIITAIKEEGLEVIHIIYTSMGFRIRKRSGAS